MEGPMTIPYRLPPDNGLGPTHPENAAQITKPPLIPRIFLHLTNGLAKKPGLTPDLDLADSH